MAANFEAARAQGRDAVAPPSDIGEIVNLDDYPIRDLGSPTGRAVVASCRNQFDDSVSCHLPNFVRLDAIEKVLDEVRRVEDRAFYYDQMRGAYNLEDPKVVSGHKLFDPDDPMGRLHRRHLAWLGYDEFGAASPLRRLFEWDTLTRFVGAVLGEPVLYRVDDPLMGVLVNMSREGDELGWHIDSHDFAITLLLQEADAGGLYQYVPMTGPEDRNFDLVPALFDGDETAVRTVPMKAGSLVIFRGRNTLHRVTPIEGKTPRLLALFSYDNVSDRHFSESFRRNVLGRTTVRGEG